MTQLNDKVVVVTGASKGMGSHFVDALVAAGARVACLARASDELTAVVDRHGAQARAFPCDVADSAQVEAAIAEAAAHFGQLDVLINNAAIFHPFLVEKATDAQVLQHLAINVMGPIWCIRAAIPHLRRTRGQVVTISSESVRMPYPYLTVYAATKAAVETLSQGLRDELREDGIRVSILRSGSVAGGTGGYAWDPEVKKAFFETIQRTGHAAFGGDFAEPTSMAKAMIALVSLPDDVSIDFMETRAAKPARADTHARALTPRRE